MRANWAANSVLLIDVVLAVVDLNSPTNLSGSLHKGPMFLLQLQVVISFNKIVERNVVLDQKCAL